MGENSNATLPVIPEANNPVPAPALAAPAVPIGPTIKALKLNNSSLNKIKQLDIGKHNWLTWSKVMMNLFLLNSCGGYILGKIPHPINHESVSAWDVNNLCVITAIKMCCMCEESVLLHNASNANDAWNILWTRHEKLGPVTQILLIQAWCPVQVL